MHEFRFRKTANAAARRGGESGRFPGVATVPFTLGMNWERPSAAVAEVLDVACGTRDASKHCPEDEPSQKIGYNRALDEFHDSHLVLPA